MNIKDMYINFIDYGNKNGKTLVFLHGWGQNIDMMKPLGDLLDSKYRIIIVDLPGFGKSSEPKTELTVYDYCDIVKELLISLKVENPTLIGHSFGGRISIIYAANYKVDKLVLLASPFKKEIYNESLKLKFLKTMKKIPILNKLEDYMKSKIGSRDYRNASPIMRKVLVNTVNEDLTYLLNKIVVPTVLIWGELDAEVPIEDAKYAESIIKDAALITFKNSTHFAYLENLNETSKIIDSLVGEK